MLKDQLPMDAIGDILVFAGGIGYLGDNNYSEHPFRDRASEKYKQVIIALGNLEFYKFYDIVSMQGVFSERFATTPITTTTMSSKFGTLTSLFDPFGLILTWQMPISTSVELSTFIGFSMARIFE